MSDVDGSPLGNDTITVVRANPSGNDDAYGNPDLGEPTRTTIDGCNLQPFVARNTSETQTPTEDVVISKWRLFMPYGSDVRPTDEIDFGNLKLQVDGDVMTWEPDDYGDGYCETYLKRWSG